MAMATALCSHLIREGRRYADQRDLADFLDAEGIDVRIPFVDEASLKLWNIEVDRH